MLLMVYNIAMTILVAKREQAAIESKIAAKMANA
jgi:hypothetical protein